MGADILEKLEREADAGWSTGYSALFREAAAEIVRLRGEVEFHKLDAGALRVQLDSCIDRLEVQTKNALNLHAMMVDAEARAEQAIAPAEAKGDALLAKLAYETWANTPPDGESQWPKWIAVVAALRPQPADGGAVAPFGYAADVDPGDFDMSHTMYLLRPGEQIPTGCTALYTRPPAAQVQQEAVNFDGTDAEVLREFIRLCREVKPVGQWPGERVCVAIERSMAREKPFRFIAEEDMSPERGHNGRGGDDDRALGGPRRATHPAGDALGAARDGYYLASFKHKANNGEVMWWKGDNAGYSPDLEQAGIYTELVPGYHDSEHTVPVPVAFLEGLRVRRTVDPGDSLNTMFWSAKMLRAALQHRGDSRGGEGS